MRQRGKRLILLGSVGCANTPTMRDRLEAAIREAGWATGYDDVDVWSLTDNDPWSGYPAPSILLDGKDIFGLPEPATGLSPCCRLYDGGVPSVTAIVEQLRSRL